MAAVSIPIFRQLEIAPWLLVLGAVIFALAPQWDTCLFRLWDFVAMCAIIAFGLAATVIAS